MKKVYIESNSIKELQEKFNNKEKIIGIEFNLFNPENYKTFHCIYSLGPNDIIALYKDDFVTFEWINFKDLF